MGGGGSFSPDIFCFSCSYLGLRRSKFSGEKKETKSTLDVKYDLMLVLWYVLGRPVITSEIGNCSVFVLFGRRFLFGINMK